VFILSSNRGRNDKLDLGIHSKSGAAMVDLQTNEDQAWFKEQRLKKGEVCI